MSERRYALLLKEAIEVEVPKHAEILRKVKGITFPEATKMVREHGGFIYENLTEQEVQHLTSEFKAKGIETFTLPMEELVRTSSLIMVDNGKVENGDLCLYETIQTKEGIKREIYKIKPDQIVMLACGRVKVEEEIEKTEFTQEFFPVAGGRYLRTPAIKTKQVVRNVWKYFLDIFVSNPLRHFRIEADSFKYGRLGLKIMPTSLKNFISLISWLASYAKDAFIDKNIQFILDGDTLISRSISGLDTYDNYLLWNLQLIFYKGKEWKEEIGEEQKFLQSL